MRSVKNFIITAGGLALIIFIMSFQMACNNMLRLKQQLKFAADEAAASAALCYDAESYGMGELKFDREKAESKAGEMIESNLKYSVKWNISYYDADCESPYLCITVRNGRLKTQSVYQYLAF